jgi:hypothetical protein
MTKMLSGRFIIVLAALLSSAAIPALAHANHSWGGYHWARTTASFTLKLGDNVSSAWDSYLATTSLDWSQSNVLDTTNVAGLVTNPRNCKPTSGRVEVCSATYGNNGWLGLAQIWITGLHITQGAVKVNDTYFNTAKYNTPAWRRLVMCQEVAHTFGLDHQDETFNDYNLGSCMDYTNYPEGGVHGSIDYGPSNEYPGGTIQGDSDFDELVTIYSHLESTTTVSATTRSRMPPAANDSDSDAPVQLGTGQWGKLVRSTNHGRTELFELDLGGRRKVFTFVIWAEPEE